MRTAARSLIDILNTNWSERDRTLAMARVELAKRYSGASLGYFWALVKPGLFIAVYWFAIAVGVRGGAPIAEVPFIFWLIPGIVPWFFISEALTSGGAAIRANSRLVTKMVYPVSTIPVFTVVSLYYVHLMLVALMVAVFALSGFGLTVFAAQVVYYSACLLALALSLALLVSTLTVLSKDIEHMVKSTVQVLFWLTPILWPLSSLPPFWRSVVMLNPITYLVEGFRNAFVYQRWFFVEWQYTLYFWAVVLAVALLGSFAYGKSHAEFADVL